METKVGKAITQTILAPPPKFFKNCFLTRTVWNCYHEQELRNTRDTLLKNRVWNLKHTHHVKQKQQANSNSLHYLFKTRIKSELISKQALVFYHTMSGKCTTIGFPDI